MQCTVTQVHSRWDRPCATVPNTLPLQGPQAPLLLTLGGGAGGLCVSVVGQVPSLPCAWLLQSCTLSRRLVGGREGFQEGCLRCICPSPVGDSCVLPSGAVWRRAAMHISAAVFKGQLLSVVLGGCLAWSG